MDFCSQSINPFPLLPLFFSGSQFFLLKPLTIGPSLIFLLFRLPVELRAQAFSIQIWPHSL
jgi:hypothetical protein